MHTLLLQSLFPLLLITSFLSINVELSLSQDDLQHADCSEAINCGGIGNISYPFWGENRAKYCGLPGYEVKCVDNVPMINMSNINYRILKTNPSAPSVTVARQDYWETICPQTYVNTNIDFSLFNYTSGLTNLTFYYGCTSINLPGLNSSFSQPCNTNNDSVTYVTRSPLSDPVTNGFCKHGVNVPVFSTAAVPLEANPTTVQDAVDEGFELGLEIDNVQCKNCVDSGGTCGFNTTTVGFSCFCLDQAYATVCNATAPGAQGMSVLLL
ncbi:LEAF RUST 10 DISEASE-RESISTANCE LOCUS RECEPTOR-LIKE PROTEIN KINASE-like 2.1 [Prunus yedoensis var. nudiflora]|uniref:non-specific serine/threonine protein kinase n=1 Tax=Prunus yedoensis var. nudiflora TaxID=2094558 RepID=A0A314ZCR4_PRUYE|nr:LEAF RUST 10 DISEASE-RESISTANCE LOCUS RECEPTOR-LIKE PROTEIN KINASE-like 2.1 [Prunus yedoensis var. nudiflora]